MRKMFKYTPLYANGKEPVIEEQDVYRIDEMRQMDAAYKRGIFALNQSNWFALI